LKRLSKCSVVLVFLILAISFVSEVPVVLEVKAASDRAKVCVDPSNVNGVPGETFTINVNITTLVVAPDYMSLYGFEIKFAWGSAVLEYVSRTVKVPVDGSPAYPDGVLYKPIIKSKDELDPVAGTYWLMCQSYGTAKSFNQSGIAFSMTFKVLEPGGECALYFTSTLLSDKLGQPIQHTAYDGYVSLEGKGSAPVCAPFTSSPAKPVANRTTVTFDTSGSYDPDGGGIASHVWWFGDRKALSPAIQSAHPYTNNLNTTYTISETDALWMRVHFPNMTLDQGDNTVYALVKSGDYFYAGLYLSPGRIVKFNSPYNQVYNQIGTITLATGENQVTSLAVSGNYLYAGLNTAPGKIVKIDLTSFTYVTTLTLAGTGENYVMSLAVYGNYLYAGLNLSPGRIVKIDLTGGAFSQVGTLTLASGENLVRALVVSGTYLYAGLRTSPGKVVKINPALTPPTEVATATLNLGESSIVSLAASGSYIYAGMELNPGRVAKIDQSPARIAVITLNTGEANVLSLAVSGNYLYAGLSPSPGPAGVTKIDITGGTTFSRVGTLTFATGENNVRALYADTGLGMLYAGLGISPGMVVKINLSTFLKVMTICLGDQVKLYDKDWNLIIAYAENSTDKWSEWIKTSKINMLFSTDASKTYWGFVADTYQYYLKTTSASHLFTCYQEGIAPFGPYPFTVRLSVIDVEGSQSKTQELYLEVLHPRPFVAFTTSPDWPHFNLTTVTFDATATFDPDGFPLKWYYWDFGDGAKLNTTSPIATHMYKTNATYSIGLTVSDIENLWSFLGGTVYVVNCDVNNNKIIAVQDLHGIGKAYGSIPDAPNWNINADVDKDGVVNTDDLKLLNTYYGNTLP